MKENRNYSSFRYPLKSILVPFSIFLLALLFPLHARAIDSDVATSISQGDASNNAGDQATAKSDYLQAFRTADQRNDVDGLLTVSDRLARIGDTPDAVNAYGIATARAYDMSVYSESRPGSGTACEAGKSSLMAAVSLFDNTLSRLIPPGSDFNLMKDYRDRAANNLADIQQNGCRYPPVEVLIGDALSEGNSDTAKTLFLLALDLADQQKNGLALVHIAEGLTRDGIKDWPNVLKAYKLGVNDMMGLIASNCPEAKRELRAAVDSGDFILGRGVLVEFYDQIKALRDQADAASRGLTCAPSPTPLAPSPVLPTPGPTAPVASPTVPVPGPATPAPVATVPVPSPSASTPGPAPSPGQVIYDPTGTWKVSSKKDEVSGVGSVGYGPSTPPTIGDTFDPLSIAQQPAPDQPNPTERNAVGFIANVPDLHLTFRGDTTPPSIEVTGGPGDTVRVYHFSDQNFPLETEAALLASQSVHVTTGCVLNLAYFESFKVLAPDSMVYVNTVAGTFQTTDPENPCSNYLARLPSDFAEGTAPSIFDVLILTHALDLNKVQNVTNFSIMYNHLASRSGP